MQTRHVRECTLADGLTTGCDIVLDKVRVHGADHDAGGVLVRVQHAMPVEPERPTVLDDERRIVAAAAHIRSAHAIAGEMPHARGHAQPCEARLRKSLLAYLAQASGQLEAFQLTAAEERALADTPQARRQLDFA